MDGPVHVVPPVGAEALGDDHHRAGGQAGEDAHRQVDDHAGGAHGGQGHLAHEPAHHQGVHRVVELLKEGAEPQGEEEAQQLFPDHALGDVAGGLAQQTHGNPSKSQILRLCGRSAYDSTRFRLEKQGAREKHFQGRTAGAAGKRRRQRIFGEGRRERPPPVRRQGAVCAGNPDGITSPACRGPR